jgi:2-succinyl-6-hydroxy-2,4-cyclohexadiene-1-carboxylate synthase
VAALHRTVDGAGPRVVLVHGFTQTGRSWAAVTNDLAADHEVVRVDAPGHGGSDAIRADLGRGAELLAEAGGRATYVGYSMGGRLALRLALDRPEVVRSLVLLGATAGIDDPTERAGRRADDEALADRIERDGVDSFLHRWLAQPLFATLPDDPDERAARAANPPTGLASSLRLAGTGTMDPPWWGELNRITAPTLVLAGEHDAKFTALGGRLAAAIGPPATFRPIGGAGHAVHLEASEVVAEQIRAFTAELADRGGPASRGRAG